MNTWRVWFNSPRDDKDLCEPMLIEAQTEEEALTILVEKFNRITEAPAIIIKGERIKLNDEFSFSIDENEYEDLCIVMNIHGHKHLVARVRPYFVKRKLDFTDEIKFTMSYAWFKEYRYGEDDFEMYEYSRKR